MVFFDVLSLKDTPKESPYFNGVIIQRLLQKGKIPKIGVSVITLSEGQTLNPHYHEKTKTIVFVLEGEGIVTLNNEEHQIKKDDVITYSEKVIHSFKAAKGTLRLLSIETPPVYSPEKKERDTVFVQ